MVIQGSIISLNFNPQSGNELAGSRPALIISNDLFNKINNMTFVCPITNSQQKIPFQIPLDDRTKTTGCVLCDQAKMLDINSREYKFIEMVPKDILEEAIDIIKSIMEI